VATCAGLSEVSQLEPVHWCNDVPCSVRFGDVYRTRYDALAQAQTVFLQGCELPARWYQKTHFTILEAGFGLGLNFLTTWATWTADAQRCPHLHYIGIEAFPASADDLLHSAQALDLASDPLANQIQPLAQQLATQWRGIRRGVNHFLLEDQRLTLELHVGDVQPMLAALPDHVDAVYLDGFSPALNPGMWSEQTLALVAQRCRPGTRLATYTVAGAVRRRLTALGFEVRKSAGLPPKRERLQAVFGSYLHHDSGAPSLQEP